MKALVNYLLGTARVRVTGPYPERVINLCAQSRVPFWGLEWEDENTVQLTVYTVGLKKLEGFAHKAGCTFELRSKDGLFEFLSRFRRRYGFLVGLTVCICLAGILSQFILTVELSGNETLSDAVILQQLCRHGVRVGAYGPGLDRRHIEQQIMLELKGIAWMTINLHGTKAQVLVREVQPAPEIADEEGIYHVAARTDGIVTRVEVQRGEALVKPGDTVGKGEILISGTVTAQPPLYSDAPPHVYDLHAAGRVWARTWRTVTAVMPVQAQIKTAAEGSKRTLAINFFGSRAEIFGNSSNPTGLCDRITKIHQTTLPGGDRLPVWIGREETILYKSDWGSINLDAAVELLEEQLSACLRRLAGEEGELVEVRFSQRVVGGLLHVTATGECVEEIGTEVPAR